MVYRVPDFQQKFSLGSHSIHLLWDINAIRRELPNLNPCIQQYSTKQLIVNNPSNINVEYAMTTDISVPGIIIELEPKRLKLIDGNHRLYKANALGIEKFECYYLPFEDQIKFIEDFSMEDYNRMLDKIKEHEST
ncbi:hypothetical protein D3C76_1271720 [compost metagenome]